MKLRVAILQQSEGTPPGSSLEWLADRGHDYVLCRLDRNQSLPSLDDVDMIIVLGGSMNVDDLELHPWLATEKAWLKQAITTGKTCLGLCLGGQLLAQIMGGKVRKHAHWEVGWHPVNFTNGKILTVFQFHQDTFDLPDRARLFASNPITVHQAFSIGHRTIGLQFHPEATEAWIRECSNEKPYPLGPYVQTPQQLREGIGYLAPMKIWFFDLLDQLAAMTGSCSGIKYP